MIIIIFGLLHSEMTISPPTDIIRRIVPKFHTNCKTLVSTEYVMDQWLWLKYDCEDQEYIEGIRCATGRDTDIFACKDHRNPFCRQTNFLGGR